MASQSARLNSVRLSEVLRDYAADNEVALARHLAAVVPAGTAETELQALDRSLFAVVAGLGINSTMTPGAFTAQQHLTVV